MELAVPYADQVSDSPVTFGSLLPKSSDLQADISSSEFVFWDWHSWITLGLLTLIGYHLWVFRSFYQTYFMQLRSAIRSRNFEVDIDVNMMVQTAVSTETVTVCLTPHSHDSAPVMLEMNEIPVELEAVCDDGDHFHDCQ